MNIFAFISVLLFVLYLQTGIYVLSNNRKSGLNQLFFLVSLCFAIWSFAYIFVYSAPDPATAILWDSIAAFGYCLFPAFMVAFYIRLCNCQHGNRWYYFFFFTLLFTGIILVVAANSGVWTSKGAVKGKYAWHFMHNPQNFYYILFYVYLVVSICIAFYYLFKWRFRIYEKQDLSQFRLFFYSLVLFILLGVLFDIVFPALNLVVMPNMAHITSLPWIAGIAVAIVKYRIMGNSVNYLIANRVIDQIKEIVLICDSQYKVLQTNPFTSKLLGEATSKLIGQEVKVFFKDPLSFAEYQKEVVRKNQLGPREVTLVNPVTSIEIDCQLFFLAVRDRYKDFKGYIIYGHDNTEAQSLKKEIIVRQQAEKNLLAISEVLETRVLERTNELTNSYKELQVKITERMRVEEQIKSDINEKEVLINEIHNRVKSNMQIIISLIKSHDKGNLSKVASLKFKELSQRVRSLLVVHENLYLSINYSDVDFANFIKTIADELLSFYKRAGKVDIQFEVSDVFLDVDYAIPMGIIVNELLGNALTHAFSDYYLRKNADKEHLIFVKYTYENGHYEISISDNGKGLPKAFNIEDLGTNGLPLAEILVKDQINGQLEFFSSKEGTMFKITFYSSK